MPSFPSLKTGAVAQYPAQRWSSFATHVVRFVDGTEQRHRERSGPQRRWVIRLSLLDEVEIAQVEAFYLSSQGQFGTFDFPDPWTATTYPNCSFEHAALEMNWTGPGKGGAILVVKQNG